MISSPSLATFDGGKYFARNLVINSSHVSIDSIGKELNHNFALSLFEKGKEANVPYQLKHHCVFGSHISQGSSLCVRLGSELALSLNQLNYIGLQLEVLGIDGQLLYAGCCSKH